MELDIVVNENDEIIGSASRDEIDAQKLFYRVSALRITNSQGEILITQRAMSKPHAPGRRGPAVAGTNEKGETYISNIIKETKEEIGIDIDESMLITGPKTKTTTDHNYFCQRFYTTIDRDIQEFTTHPEDVMDIKRIKKDDLIYQIANSPELFTINTPKNIKILGLI